MKHRDAIRPRDVATIQHQNVEVDIQAQRRPEALHHRHRARLSTPQPATGLLITKPAEDLTHRNAQHTTHQVRVARQQEPTRPRDRQHPLTNPHRRQHPLHPVRCAVRHATPPTRGTEPPTLARKRDQTVMVARTAREPGKAVRVVTARLVPLQLPNHEVRKTSTRRVELIQEVGKPLPHDPVEQVGRYPSKLDGRRHSATTSKPRANGQTPKTTP